MRRRGEPWEWRSLHWKPIFLSLLYLRLRADGNCGPIKTYKSVICSASRVTFHTLAYVFCLHQARGAVSTPSWQTDNGALNPKAKFSLAHFRSETCQRAVQCCAALFAKGCETLLRPMSRWTLDQQTVAFQLQFKESHESFKSCCTGMIKPSQTFDLVVKIWFLHNSNNKQTLINESDNMDDEKALKPWKTLKSFYRKVQSLLPKHVANRTTPGMIIKMLFGMYL